MRDLRPLTSILILFVTLFVTAGRLDAQYVYTIKADSVEITNCDSAELILENHTQNIPGFLFNTGNGRTIFRRGLQQMGNGSFLIGADTLSPWVQGGNSFGTTGILGTMDNNPLDLYSNGAQRIRLATTGRTLFGSTSDNGLNKFQFTGSIFDTVGYLTNFSSPFTGSNNSGFLRLRWGSGDGAYISFFNQANPNRRGYIATPSDNRALIIGDQVAVTIEAPYMSVGQEGSLGATLSVMDATGVPAIAQRYDMGVAHITPTDTIVYDLVVTATGHTMLNNQPTSGGSIIDNGNVLQVYGSSYFSDSVRIAGLTQDSTQTRVLVSDANGNLYYRSAASLALDNPVRSSLAVNGTIKSKKLLLSPDGWADYVFDSTYRLPQLEEVEDYIHKEHHLPGIPSAAAIQKDSLDVGAGQAALLKKVEELTLYTIEQKKEIEDMRARMERLEKLLTDKNNKIYNK